MGGRETATISDTWGRKKKYTSRKKRTWNIKKRLAHGWWRRRKIGKLSSIGCEDYLHLSDSMLIFNHRKLFELSRKLRAKAKMPILTSVKIDCECNRIFTTPLMCPRGGTPNVEKSLGHVIKMKAFDCFIRFCVSKRKQYEFTFSAAKGDVIVLW